MLRLTLTILEFLSRASISLVCLILGAPKQGLHTGWGERLDKYWSELLCKNLDLQGRPFYEPSLALVDTLSHSIIV